MLKAWEDGSFLTFPIFLVQYRECRHRENLLPDRRRKKPVKAILTSNLEYYTKIYKIILLHA